MSNLVGLLLIAVWLESLALAFGLGWLLRGAHDNKERHSNGMIEMMEDAMAGNGRALWETHQQLDQVRATLEWLERSLETKEAHLQISRKKMGEIRGRPYEGPDPTAS